MRKLRRSRHHTEHRRAGRESGRRLLTRRLAALFGAALFFPAGIAVAAGRPVLGVAVELGALAGAALVAFAVAFADEGGPQRHPARLRTRRRGKKATAALGLASLFVLSTAFSAGAGGEVAAALPAEAGATSTDTTGTTDTASGETEAAPTTATGNQAGVTTTEGNIPTTGTGEGESPAPESDPASPSDGSDLGSGPPGSAGTGGGSDGLSEGSTGGSGATPSAGASSGGASTTTPNEGSPGESSGTSATGAASVAPPAPDAGRGPGSKPRPLDAEVEEFGVAATVWLHRILPDPTPPAKRLSASFARDLRAVARTSEIKWWVILGVLRERGARGSFPADRAGLKALATKLGRLGAAEHPRRAVVRLEGKEAAEQALALAHYNRAVGMWALVHGLEAATDRLAKRVLADGRITIYGAGRADIEAGRVDVRVLVLIRYLRVVYRQLSISSLVAGHRLFARPGRISAHVYGLAVDISSIRGESINGHQEPGDITERAIRAILLLPAEVQAQQVISLLGLGGASFPLADHYDHIHVGY